MDLRDRIARRRARRTERRLVLDWDALNPAVHLDSVVGRESVFEAILDAIDPVFDGVLPPDLHVWGPAGSGKSAIVTTLVAALRDELSRRRSVIPTATRPDGDGADIGFAYLDARRTTSRFKVYQRLLDELVDEPIPERGIGTDALRRRLQDELPGGDGVLVAVDHIGEPASPDLPDVREFFEPLSSVATLTVARSRSDDRRGWSPDDRVHIPAYEYELVDILTIRGAQGISQGLDHTDARRLAEWADGNAHDALAALYAAAISADAAGADQLRAEDIDAGMDAVPRGSVTVGRLLALSSNEQLVLDRLIDGSFDRHASIDSIADDIAARSDLMSGTVQRLLYELAQTGVLKRTRVPAGQGSAGRHPSGVVPQFSTAVYNHLRRGSS